MRSRTSGEGYCWIAISGLFFGGFFKERSCQIWSGSLRSKSTTGSPTVAKRSSGGPTLVRYSPALAPRANGSDCEALREAALQPGSVSADLFQTNRFLFTSALAPE